MEATATQYIAFLRAINVGGRFVTMERLRGLFAELGLGGVRSYIQSGNIFFESDERDRAALRVKIERHISQSLGYDVTALLRTLPEVEYALELDPFKDVIVTPDIRLCILFLSDPLPNSFELPFQSAKGDFELLQATAGEVFALVRVVGGSPANPAAFLERKLKLRSSTRFFDTTTKILAAAKNG